MQNDLLNTLLHILINGPAVGSKECENLIDSAVSSWLGAKTRRKCPPKIFNTAEPPIAGPGSASENVPVVIVHDACVQTTDGDTQSFHSVAEEVEETSKALEICMMKILIMALALSFHKRQKMLSVSLIISL